MATGLYLRGLPCTAQLSIKIHLKQDAIVHLSAGVTATTLNLVSVSYIFGYLTITEERK